jgi:hypothetical protein
MIKAMNETIIDFGNNPMYEKPNAYNSENLNAQWSEDPNAKATMTKFNQ